MLQIYNLFLKLQNRKDNQVTIGLPEIYLWDGSKVEIIVGEVAFEFTT